MTVGENFVSLVGSITRADLKKVGEKQIPCFKGTISIPLDETNNTRKAQFIKIAAWRNIAEALSAISKDKVVKIHGHIEESSYEGSCKHCNGKDKKYWTEVVVDNFIVVEG